MQVGIAGAGAIAMGYAALLLQNGHGASVWSPSGERTAALDAGTPLQVSGAIEGEFRPAVCRTAQELAASDVIIVALPAYGYRMVLDSLLPHIEARHVVIISGHLSFAALYLARKLAERGVEIPIGAWNTTVLTCKAQGPMAIKVGAIRGKIDLASVPVRMTDRVHAACTGMFGDRFVVRDDILTITLSNTNPQSHLAIALCNLTRIELGESWGQNSNVTPAVGRLIEALDVERLAIAKSLGKSVRTVFDHYSASFGIEDDSVSRISLTRAAQGHDPAGPKDPSTRYVLEDVPFGLVPLLYLAQLAGVPAPLHQSGLAIMDACYGRDFSAGNDLLEDLGTPDLTSLNSAIVEGYL